MTNQRHVLVVDDEQAIREMVVINLELVGYQCSEASNSNEGFVSVIELRPDVILVDWMMPNGSGVELIKRLRKNPATEEIPILMLTARADESDRLRGFDLGADDYITKPFSPKELVARIRSVLRRSSSWKGEEDLVVNGLRLDFHSRQVTCDEIQIEVSPKEFQLLHFFMIHQERVYSRTQLLDFVWGANVYIEERTVDVHIRRLRRTLGERYERYIQTVRGSGYRFSARI